jgi:hypothetical protein
MPPARWSRESSGAWPTRLPDRLAMRVRCGPSVFITVLAAALLGALLGVVGPPRGAGAAVSVCHPGRQVVCIDRGDGGHTVHVALGQTVMVRLGGSGLRWSDLHEVGPHLVDQHGATAVRHGVLTAAYVATAVGRTGLRASEAPTCARGKACPQFIVLWQVRIVVARRE